MQDTISTGITAQSKMYPHLKCKFQVFLLPYCEIMFNFAVLQTKKQTHTLKLVNL